jgi:predicted metal-dependent peptidase
VRPPNEAEQHDKAEVRSIWETDRAALIFERPFIASLAMRLPLVPVVDARVPTACTDGKTIWFNPAFLRGLSPAERVFVLAHEVWHCALLHSLRRGEREPRCWNLAVDHEVNGLLVADGWTAPRGAVWFERWSSLSAEEVYERLLAEGPRPGDEPLDVHLEPGPAGHRPCGGAPRDAEAEEDAPDLVRDPDFRPEVHGREVWEPWPGRVQVARQICAGHGTLSRAEAAVLARLSEGTVDWRRVLRDFVTRTLGGERSWSPPARRHVHRGLYLPSLRGAELDIVVAMDTSGSVHSMLPEMLAEVHGLVSAFARWTIRLIWCDCEIQHEELWTSDDPPDLKRLHVPLGGGTDFRPVFTRLQDAPPRILLYVTDGMGDAPEHAPPYPVLWVLGGRHTRAPTPWGQVAHFPTKQEFEP